MKKALKGLALVLVFCFAPLGAEEKAAEKKDVPATQPAAPQAKPETKPQAKEEAKKPVTPGPLDGKSFVGEIADKGQKANTDTFIFKEGRFRSTASDKLGFKDAAYTTSGEGKVMRFRATTVNPSGAKMEWDGVVKGDKLEGTAILTEQGKPAGENKFKGKITK